VRHFAFTFHDTTFEGLAVTLEIEVMVGTTTTASRAMADRLARDI